MKPFRFACALAAVAVAFAVHAPVPAAAQEFPNRPIRIVVGFGPGGLGDVTTRAVAQKMQESLGRPVVVENLPGAGGLNAAATVARAAPDGHTMLLVSGQNAIAPSMFKTMPYDWRRDLATVSTMGVFDFVVVVTKDSPLKTLDDFIVAAKKDAKLNAGTISAGSAQHLTALLFNSRAGIDATIVPHRTTGELVTGLMSGSLQVVFETLPGVMGQLQGGALRALSVSSDRRAALLPNVPTATEGGIKDYNIISWNGFVVPAKTPRPIIDRLNKEVAAALKTQDVRDLFRKLAVEPRPSTPEEMQKTYDDDEARWRTVIAGANIQQK